MFCEKAVELVRELHRAAEGRLPAFNVRAGALLWGYTTQSGVGVCLWFSSVDMGRSWAGRFCGFPRERGLRHSPLPAASRGRRRQACSQLLCGAGWAAGVWPR